MVDFNEASGSFLLYNYARICSIFRKFEGKVVQGNPALALCPLERVRIAVGDLGLYSLMVLYFLRSNGSCWTTLRSGSSSSTSCSPSLKLSVISLVRFSRSPH